MEVKIESINGVTPRIGHLVSQMNFVRKMMLEKENGVCPRAIDQEIAEPVMDTQRKYDRRFVCRVKRLFSKWLHKGAAHF